MENHQEFFSKLGGSESHHNDHSDPLLGVSGGGVDDDPFNDSGADFFDKFMAEEAVRIGNSNSHNNGSNSMLMSAMDSGINAQSLLEEALHKSSGSVSLEAKDMEEDDVVGDHAFKAQGMTKQADFHMEDGSGVQNQLWSNFGTGPLSSGIKKPDLATTPRNWFQAAGSTSPQNNSTFENTAHDRPLNATLDEMPLDVSLDGGGSITATLRRKGSNAQLNAPKAGSVIKANVTSSKMRSNKSDGLLARALKARYNSSPQISKYNVNAEGAAAAMAAKVPNRTMSAIGGTSGTGSISNTAMSSIRSGNALFGGGSSANLNAVEEEGGGVHNASWGAPPSKRKPGGASLFSQMLSSPTNTRVTQNNEPKIHPSTSASSLLRKKQPKLVAGGGSRSSMQDLLRLCKKQSKTQSLLRQSSAHSLLKQTSSQSLKDFSKKIDVSSLLPPQHTSPHMNNRNRLNNINPGASFQANGNFSTSNPVQNTIETSSLLHQSCRLYPTTSAVVESALRIDPEAVRRAVPITLEKGQSKKPQNVYGYPVNVALTHGASMEVLLMLTEAGPDVLVQKDGTDGSGSLGIALMSKCDVSVVNMLVQANPDCVKVSDRRGNYPLHVASNYGLSLGIVMRLYAMYPKALQMRNFHSETPLDIAQRSTRCAEEVMNFLQATAFSPLENSAHHLDYLTTDDLEDGLDDIMETNF